MAEPTSRHHRRGAPSPCLLSILAAIITSSSAADGSPLATQQHPPPPFLDPSFRSEDLSTTTNLSTILVEHRVTRISKRITKRGTVSDKYVKGEDGRWRQADSYSLYGSTICPSCTDPPHPVIGDTIPSTSQPAVSAHPNADVLDILPNGWRPVPNKRSFGQNAIILTLSSVLAVLICGLMIGCVVWTKKKRREKDKMDLEMKRLTDDPATQRDVRIKQKFWAKATARWKANARSRQRKLRRSLSGAKPRADSSESMHPTPSPSTSSSPSISPPPPLSHVDTTVDPPIVHHTDNLDRKSIIAPLPLSLVAIDAAADPPAYNRSGNLLETVLRRGHDPIISRSDIHRRLHDYGESLSHGSERGILDDEEIPYPPTSAHVATDDKEVLARMAQLASAPHPAFADHEHSLSAPPHVPVWQDEELPDFGDSSAGASSSSPLGAPPFPSPPARLAMASSMDHGDCFPDDDDYYAGEVSAPPFEAQWVAPDAFVPSAPPLEDLLEEPSAPCQGHV